MQISSHLLPFNFCWSSCLNFNFTDQPESELAVFISTDRHNPASLEESQVGAKEDYSALITTSVTSAITSASFILKRAADLGKELYQQCSLQEQAYYDNNVKIGDDASLNMCLSTVGQDNDLWDYYRFGRITGSVSYPLFTYSKNKNAKWKQKLESVFESDFKGNIDTDNGLMYEKDAKERYEESTGNTIVEVGILVHPLVPWFGYSADGLIFENGECVRLWENKTPKCGKTCDASTICQKAECMDRNENLKQKHKFYGQIQLGMLLFSLPICDFTLYSMGSDQVAIKGIGFNEKFCLDYTELLTRTYFKIILPWLCSKQS